MEEAITRLKLAARVGADVCFIEGVRDKHQLESTVAALAPTPVNFLHEVASSFPDIYSQVLCNVISGGLTPCFTSSEAEAMGAKIISEASILLDNDV
jgi:2-methylisocitrate lyase-like PEP mutase family enzyme